MNQPSQISPLYAIAGEYIKEDCPNLHNELFQDLYITISQFMQNMVTYDYTVQKFESLAGNSRPVQRISSILAQCNIPPSADTRFRQAQAISVMSKKKMNQWTEVEDQRLLSAIHKYGTDNWALVASHLGNTRTRAQCSQRWFRGLDPRLVKLSWTEQEEAKLLELVEKYGNHSWMKVASAIGNRSDAQCRYHYYQMMKYQNKEIKEPSRPQLQISHSAPLGALKAAAAAINFGAGADSDDESSIEPPAKLPPIDDILQMVPRKKTIPVIQNFKQFLNSSDPNTIL